MSALAHLRDERRRVGNALTWIAEHPDERPPVEIVAPLMRQIYREERARTWMYAIQAGDEGPIKLGVAKDPRERLRTLQTANAEELRLLAVWRIPPCMERAIHGAFADLHIRGEWFRPSAELVEYVMFEDDVVRWEAAA